MYIRGAKSEESCKYVLIGDTGKVVKEYFEEDEPVNFTNEIQKHLPQLPTTEERLTATEAAILTLMGV